MAPRIFRIIGLERDDMSEEKSKYITKDGRVLEVASNPELYMLERIDKIDDKLDTIHVEVLKDVHEKQLVVIEKIYLILEKIDKLNLWRKVTLMVTLGVLALVALLFGLRPELVVKLISLFV